MFSERLETLLLLCPRELVVLSVAALRLVLVVELERVEYVPTAVPLSVVAPLRLYDERDEAPVADERDDTLSTRLMADERELAEPVELAERELSELVERADTPDERDEALLLDSEDTPPRPARAEL